MNNKRKVSDLNILYCNYNNCPLNSLYQCTYCQNYRCIRHSKILDDSTCVCVNCIVNDNTVSDIYKAIKLNKKNNNKYKNILLNFLSLEWMNCKSKIQ